MWNIPAAAMSGGNSAPIYELMMAQMEDPNSLKDCVEIPAQVEKRGVLSLKDGRVFERFSCPLVFEEVVEGRVCSYRDITARQKAEKERERLLSAIEQAAETIVITDVTGAIEYVNPAFEDISGYTRAEVIGANPNILSSGHHDTAFFASLWNTVIGGDTWKGRIVNRRKDGITFTEDAVISPVRDADGQIAHFVAVKRDVSREIELEAQLNQSQKMEAIGQLAGGIAHDFNNLLQVIDGHIDLLLATLPADSANREDAETVRAATDRAANLTRQLLAFSRQQWIQPVDLDLNQLVADLMKLLRRVIGAPISLRIIPSPDPAMIHADPGQIEQVLVNLCINARDAMPHGGALSIECENVVSDSDPDGVPEAKAGAFVCLSVTDSGTGMDAETLEHIFEPFFTTKETGRGTGLGLATVYGIIQQHKGVIQVDSRPGAGSTFKVFLPKIQSETAEEKSRANGLEPDLEGNETILVVEDEEAVRDLSLRILEQYGYRVLSASDGEEALRVFEEHVDEIQLVLLDIVMPKMSGREVMKRLREKRPSLPVLLTTGYSPYAEDINFTIEDGLQLLRKPYHTHELLGRIREILDSRPGEAGKRDS
ncbi:MAG: PAS domain S-box protein, partial [Acidobacteriota bacterium]